MRVTKQVNHSHCSSKIHDIYTKSWSLRVKDNGALVSNSEALSARFLNLPEVLVLDEVNIKLGKEFLKGRDGDELVSSSLLQFPYGRGGLDESRLKPDGSYTNSTEL